MDWARFYEAAKAVTPENQVLGEDKCLVGVLHHTCNYPPEKPLEESNFMWVLAHEVCL